MAQGQAAAPVRPGQTVALEITGLTHEGAGVGRVSGFALFVPGTAPGDRVQARVVEVRKGFGRAALQRVLTAAPSRVVPRCPVVAECGGCQLQHIDYAEQLARKRQQVQDALARIGGLTDVPVHPTLGMADPWNYRGKAQFPVGLGPGGRPVAGFYAAGSHRIVDINDCAIQHPVANQVLAAVKVLAERYRVPIYDEVQHSGLLRHVLVRVARESGEAMAVLVTTAPEFPGGRALAREIITAVPACVAVLQNINPERTNVVLGAETRLLAGRESIIERVSGLEFAISARSFFQVNPEQTEVLYSVALDYARLTGSETVLDLYCGIGSITLLLAQRAALAYGVEVVPEAVADARANAQRNGISNARFLAGEVERVLPDLADQGVQPAVVLVDPPRKGCDAGVLAAIADLAPARGVYVSCNPATLARDLKLLAERGYRTLEVQPVDMFPHTAHVEAVALCARP